MALDYAADFVNSEEGFDWMDAHWDWENTPNWLMMITPLLTLVEWVAMIGSPASIEEYAHRYSGDTDYLDVEEDYSGMEKYYPVITFTTHNERDIVSPQGFVNHMWRTLGLTNPPTVSKDDADEYYVSFVYMDAGWTWIDEGAACPVDDVIYYTFGDAIGANVSPLAEYVTDISETWG